MAIRYQETMSSDPANRVTIATTPEISVCICTFKRPELLGQLLARLENQQTNERFTYSVVVVDNDRDGSAREVVTALSSASPLSVTYVVEPQQNIALARNRAIGNAKGEYIAFIDDDEFPADNWLSALLNTLTRFDVAGVLGPVQPHFESTPPAWATKGRFFERPTHTTGYQINWELGRTGNVLFRKDILAGEEVAFRSQFDTAGEDVDFFRRMMEKGCRFVWCNEAAVGEFVPDARCSRSYLLRRALLRGSNFHKHPTNRLQNIARSLVAVPCYAVMLPVLALFGQHVFLKYLIKFLDHSSRLLSFLGITLVTQRPV